MPDKNFCTFVLLFYCFFLYKDLSIMMVSDTIAESDLMI